MLTEVEEQVPSLKVEKSSGVDNFPFKLIKHWWEALCVNDIKERNFDVWSVAKIMALCLFFSTKEYIFSKCVLLFPLLLLCESFHNFHSLSTSVKNGILTATNLALCVLNQVFRRKKLVIRLGMSAGGLVGRRAEQACWGHNFVVHCQILKSFGTFAHHH